MEINYLGHSSFKLKGKTAVLVTDPFSSEMVGLKYPQVEADIVTVSHHHSDHDYLNGVKDYSSVVDGPGEYEIKDISLLGFQTYHDDKNGIERGKNTIYVIEIEGIRLLHLGDLGHKLSEKLVEEIGAIDILMIPVGGHYTIDSQTALSVVDAVEPSIVLPMHYKLLGMKPEISDNLNGVEEFLKGTGLPVENLPKLVLKKHEIPEDNKKVIVLEVKK